MVDDGSSIPNEKSVATGASATLCGLNLASLWKGDHAHLQDTAYALRLNSFCLSGLIMERCCPGLKWWLKMPMSIFCCRHPGYFMCTPTTCRRLHLVSPSIVMSPCWMLCLHSVCILTLILVDFIWETFPYTVLLWHCEDWSWWRNRPSSGYHRLVVFTYLCLISILQSSCHLVQSNKK